MTEEEMLNRIKEINQETKKLSLEKREYENFLFNKKKNERFESHKRYIGKCYISKGFVGNENKYIKAFKIIKILDKPNENKALCTALVDGYRTTCWKEYGIQNMVLDVWGYNKYRMINEESDPKVLDFYNEITQEEFERLYREHLNKIEDNIYK